MAEPYITSVHVTCGIYEASVKSGTESSMFHPHGLNIDNAAIIKKYTKLPVGAVGGINSPELCEPGHCRGQDRLCHPGPPDAGRPRVCQQGQARP